MSDSRPAADVFEQEFLPIRAKLLEVAASLDRLDRADGTVANDLRRKQLRAAIEVLINSSDDRAEQLQLIFSRPYVENWREELEVRS